MRTHRLLSCLYAMACLVPAYGEVPEDTSLSMLVQMVHVAGPLNSYTRDTFLTSSGLARERLPIVREAVDRAFELSNIEGAVAREREQPNADFAALEKQRHEILQSLKANLEQKLGADAWTKVRSFLRSIGEQIQVRRGICNEKSVVYTLGMVFNGNSEITAIAVTDSFYPAGNERLFAEAKITSPAGREVAAQSPSITFRVHATAVATLQIETEDGIFQPSYRFGEICGEEAAPRLYANQH